MKNKELIALLQTDNLDKLVGQLEKLNTEAEVNVQIEGGSVPKKPIWKFWS